MLYFAGNFEPMSLVKHLEKKTLFFICIILFLPFALLSQDKDTRIWDSPYGQDRFVVTFNIDQWMDVPDSIQIRPFSLGFNSYIMFDYTFGESSFSWALGYGLSSHNVHHNGFFKENEEEGNRQLSAFPEDYSFKKNKHSANYLEIPVELRFRTKGIKKFKLYAGGKIGYLVNFHSKIIDDQGKRKEYTLDYVNRLRYGVTGSIGYNSFAISAFYSLTPLLKDQDNGSLIPFSLGITYFLL